jgi:hypothetical protein
MMIDRAITKKESLDAFIANSIYETEKYKIVPIKDRPTTEDWHVLVETHSILKPFNTHTKRLQSRASDETHGAIWEAYPSIEYLLRHILTKKREYAEEYETSDSIEDDAAVSESRRYIKTLIDNCRGKFDQYYKILDTLSAYMASLVLYPGQKLSFVDYHWIGRRIWIERVKKDVKRLRKSSYKRRFNEALISDVESIVEAGVNFTRMREPDDLDVFLNPPNFYTAQAVPPIDEYKEFLKTPVAYCEKPLRWWQLHQKKWLNFYRMTMDMLLILFMNAECERVFSAVGYLINGRRNHLKEDIIEATSCLRSWSES